MSSKALVKGSLQDIQQNNKKSLAETFLNVECIVICDTSGSMSTHDAPGGKSRYEAMCSELKRLQVKYPGKIAVISFNYDAEFCPSGIPSEPSGTTMMHKALDFVTIADGIGIKIILTSDGHPDSERLALDAARSFKSKIDTIYIGPEDGSGREFLARLASLTGGQSLQTDAPGMLGNGVETLLLSG